mgnify:CR=1 FL=1
MPDGRALFPRGGDQIGRGLGGGGAGQPGVFRINGEERFPQGKVRMEPGSVVYLETPGGGGFGTTD